MSDSVFVLDGDGVVATEFARGPWDPDSQHGGAPAALLARAFEGTVTGRQESVVARITYEFLRPVPLGRLTVQAVVVRAGRRAQWLDGAIFTDGGTEVVRARALRVARAEAASFTDIEPVPLPSPGEGRPPDFHGDRTMFGPDAMDIRFVSGDLQEPGPAAAWFRLAVPLVNGEVPTPLQRLCAAADFGNGISPEVAWEDHAFINPDLTVYVEREPLGDWICVDARTRILREGIGVSDSLLYDTRGRVGRATQALVVFGR